MENIKKLITLEMKSGLKISGTLEQEFEEAIHLKLSEASFAYFGKK